MIASKVLLFFNTVRYLRPQQLMSQTIKRFRKPELFWNYKKEGIEHNNYNLWIRCLDDDAIFMERFDVDGILDNQVTLLNETREFNGWYYSDASHLWNFNLHYLEYLVPLYGMWRLTGDKRYKDRLNEILVLWYESGSYESDSNQSYTISLRVINQLIIIEAVNDKQRLFDSIYAQYRYLINNQEKHLMGNHYLENIKAIVICSVVFGEEDIYERYIKKLVDELDEQITKDGLHFELSLMYHKIVLEDMMRVAMILRQAGKTEYQRIVDYISRMASALYSVEFGLNRTPLFNDAGDNVAKPTKSLLSGCKEQFEIIFQKREIISGYYKLYGGNITLLFDCGELAPSYMPGHAHCDCLSFELFYFGRPVFVNCGTYQYQSKLRTFFRSTKAHNTVMICDHEQSELWGEHRAGRRLGQIKGMINNNTIIGSYINYFGEEHIRSVRLDNNILEISDKTTGDGKSFLHLAPGLRLEGETIKGVEGLDIIIAPVNAAVSTRQMPYSDNFGKLDEVECMIFSWKADEEKHGYKIIFEEK